jgi:PAS domain S-box-containing protein
MLQPRGTQVIVEGAVRGEREEQTDARVLAQLVELLPDAILIVGHAQTIKLVNSAAGAMFGYEVDEMAGMPLSSLLPVEDRARHEAHVEGFFEAPARRVMGRGRTLRGRRRSGELFPVEIALNEVTWRGGKAYAAAVRDVSERVAAEEAQRQVRESLVVADRMATLGMLAASVAHEINNPLSAAVGSLEFLEGALDAAEPEARQALREARQALEHVRAISLDLKLFSREPRGGIDTSEASRVVEWSLRMARNEIQHRARVACAFEPVAPVAIAEARLGQVLLNLVVNAAQAIPEGDAAHNEIRVGVRPVAGDRVLIEVADTGAGIAPDVASRIFAPFFTTKDAGTGTGLGLSIAHRIVTESGGTLEVQSEPGRGSVFRVFLPTTRSTSTARAATLAPQANSRSRVLVVDDEASVATMIRRLLQSEHDVTTTTSAIEALAFIEAGERFDVILSDLMMPQMTGMEFHARLGAVAPELTCRMVFLTGGAFTEKARTFLQTVPNQHIEKPFDRNQLRALVNRRAAAR